ncbi:MAG: c-type cytochrome [Campylobacterota bacterium]|nr:c-type cytochrome [Campylobacterota bacterium]
MKIVLSTALALLLIGCSNESASSAKEEIKNSVSNVTEVVKKESENVVKSVEKATNTTVDELKKEIEEGTEKVIRESKEAVHKGVKSLDKALEEKPKEAQAEIEPELGATLYAKCSACHGQNAEKKALNKSQIIKGWSASKITEALNGYKDGSYGSTMKGVMKPQVANLSSNDIKALAEYISNL